MSRLHLPSIILFRIDFLTLLPFDPIISHMSRAEEIDLFSTLPIPVQLLSRLYTHCAYALNLKNHLLQMSAHSLSYFLKADFPSQFCRAG